MAIRVLLAAIITVSLYQAGWLGYAADKVKFGIGYKHSPGYNLVLWAGQEEGIWKKYGLEVEQIDFMSTGALFLAGAAGALDMGSGRSEAAFVAMARKLPVLIVANYRSGADFGVYVLPDSPLRQPKDLAGRTISVSRLGGAAHATALYLGRALGIEGKLKFIAVGAGLPGNVAALKRDVVQGILQGSNAVAELVVKGELRLLVDTADYLPKEWADNVIFATNKNIEARPEVVRKVVAGFFEAWNFHWENPAWSIERLKARFRFSEPAARFVAKMGDPKGKRISPPALKNVLEMLIEFGVLKKEGLPPLESLYTAKFAE